MNLPSFRWHTFSVVAFAGVLLFTGCAASTDSYLKTQGATYIPYSISGQTVPNADKRLAETADAKVVAAHSGGSGFGWITLRAFRANGKEDRHGIGTPNESVLYLSADVSPLIMEPDLV